MAGPTEIEIVRQEAAEKDREIDKLRYLLDVQKKARVRNITQNRTRPVLWC